jgi:hypothetical protein
MKTTATYKLEVVKTEMGADSLTKGPRMSCYS